MKRSVLLRALVVLGTLMVFSSGKAWSGDKSVTVSNNLHMYSYDAGCSCSVVRIVIWGNTSSASAQVDMPLKPGYPQTLTLRNVNCNNTFDIVAQCYWFRSTGVSRTWRNDSMTKTFPCSCTAVSIQPNAETGAQSLDAVCTQ